MTTPGFDQGSVRVVDRQTTRQEKDRVRDAVAKLYDEIAPDVFVDRLVRHLGRKKDKHGTVDTGDVHAAGSTIIRTGNGELIRETLQGFLDTIAEEHPGDFAATLEPIGSRAEGVNVSDDGDYDYLVVLTRFIVTRNRKQSRFVAGDDVIGTLDVPKRLISSDIVERAPQYMSYFSLSQGGHPMDSEAFIVTFRKWLKDAVPEDKCEIHGSGPALSLYIAREDGGLNKVDLSLALSVHIPGASHGSAAGKVSVRNVQNRALSTAVPAGGSTRDDYYYFIASGELWKLSVCAQEKKYLIDTQFRDHPASKGIYMALKRMNAEATITLSSEDPIMSSYPLKVVLMDDHIHQGLVGRTERDLPEHSGTCAHVLKTVDTEQMRLNNVFYEDDPIFKTGQKSYLEARRIALYIRGLRRNYAGLALLHTLLISSIFATNFISCFVFGSLIVRDRGYLSVQPNFTLAVDEDARDKVTFLLWPCAVIGCLVAIIGAVTSLVLTYCLPGCTFYDSDFGAATPQMTTVFRLHRWVIPYYFGLALLHFIPFTYYYLWTECFDLWPKLNMLHRSNSANSGSAHCISHHPVTHVLPVHAHRLKALGITTMTVSFLICLLILLHLVVVLILTRARPNRLSAGWIFFGLCLCREYPCRARRRCCPCCPLSSGRPMMSTDSSSTQVGDAKPKKRRRKPRNTATTDVDVTERNIGRDGDATETDQTIDGDVTEPDHGIGGACNTSYQGDTEPEGITVETGENRERGNDDPVYDRPQPPKRVVSDA